MCPFEFPVSNSDHLIIQVMNGFLFEDRASCCWMSLGNIDDTFNFILYLDLKTFFPFKSIGKQYIIQLIEITDSQN